MFGTCTAGFAQRFVSLNRHESLAVRTSQAFADLGLIGVVNPAAGAVHVDHISLRTEVEAMVLLRNNEFKSPQVGVY